MGVKCDFVNHLLSLDEHLSEYVISKFLLAAVQMLFSEVINCNLVFSSIEFSGKLYTLSNRTKLQPNRIELQMFSVSIFESLSKLKMISYSKLGILLRIVNTMLITFALLTLNIFTIP